MLQAREFQIISLLLESAQGLSGNELAQLIGVSERTIRRDIKYIQTYIESSGCIIHSSVKNGYSLEILDEDKFNTLKKNLNDCEQTDYILEQLIINTLNDTCISQAELADKLYMSLSTLKLHIKMIENNLEKYHLEIINYKNKGMKIYGNEEQIRYAISEYIFTKYKSSVCQVYQPFFANIDLLLLKKIVIQVIEQNMLKLTDLSIDNLLIHIVILMKRASLGQLIIYNDDQIAKIEQTKSFEAARYIVKSIYLSFGLEINLNETCYLAQHIITSKKYSEFENIKVNVEIENLIKNIMNMINQICGIDFSEDKTLLHWLSLHLDIAMNRLKNNMNIHNEALDLIKKEYPLPFQIAAMAGKVIEQEKNIKVNENEIGYIAIHFAAAFSRRGNLKNANVKKILLVCGSGIGTTVLLKARIQEYFQDRIQIVNTIPGYKLNEQIISLVDVVLTTIPIDHIKSDKIINVNYLLNLDEIVFIESKIFNKEMFNKDLILQFFREDFFYTQMDFDNKEDILDFMTDQMIQKGMISEIGKVSIKERESLFSTEMSNLLAIPHCLYNDLDKTIIPVLVLKKPILWNTKYVQMVLLINVAKETFEVWDTFFPKLIHFLVKEKGVQFFLNGTSYQYFIKKIVKIFRI
ncbi:lichenan operon transcriptional antiterminator [Propionispira arboris]|uniref:Lichenan operon transcriptional antiterminator n=1 Tax=Propionispira arboris TaxID=84035 RepID=A0A1H7D5G2_9FIRM|nr:BglG family transcription antiterminator [Propionispira arboris]SEJ94792.1 lichenan operon transcriptional antiterminator [Propionispira arboris]